MSDLKESFLLEQYKRIINRIESHERIYYQMLILYITIFGVVLGFSEKVSEKELLVPFTLLSFLLFVTLICNRHNQDQRFETAYLLEIFEKRWPDISFSHFNYNFKNTFDKKSKVRKFITHPIFVLFGLTLITSAYFLRDIIKTTIYCPLNNIGHILYLILITLLIIGILLVYGKMQRKNLDQYIIDIQKLNSTPEKSTKEK